MTEQEFELLRSQQDLADLHYPLAKEWMWDYCLFLGKFTDSKGKNYDLGVHYNGKDYPGCLFSEATVYNNYEGAYKSGHMDFDSIPALVDGKPNIDKKPMLYWYKQYGFEAKIECWNRLQKLIDKQ